MAPPAGRAALHERLKRASAQLEAKIQIATLELAEQNELLQRQSAEIERAAAAKSQFMANVSHELRTPLNIVLGSTRILLQGVSGALSEAQKRNVGRIDSNARHLLRTINEILDITRIETGRMPLRLSTFAVSDLVEEVLAEAELLSARSRLTLSSEVPKGLPRMHSDREKVKRIVLHFLSNAFKFTREGRVIVQVAYRASSRRFAISVADTGIGISATDHQRVFEDFRQLDESTTRLYGGTGLGLSISRRLATMLDGRITLKSALGEGSTFTLHLPRRLAQA
jgi:signal transduction histidine kinase